MSEESSDRDRPKDQIVRHFNGIGADAYADHYSETAAEYSPLAYFYKSRRAIVIPLLQSLGGGALLDIGCGPGVFAKPCVEQGFRYHGIDVSGQMISAARRRFGDLDHVEFTTGDARRLPFPSGSMDVVMCLGMLEYVTREEEPYYLEEMARVLKPGGTVIFSFLNSSSPHWLSNDYVLPVFRYGLWLIKELLKKAGWASIRDFAATDFSSRKFTRKFRPRERVALLPAAGFIIVSKTYFAPNIFPRHLDEIFARQAVWLGSKLDRVLHKPLLGWLGQAFLVVARKDGREYPAGSHAVDDVVEDRPPRNC